jgi:hypothetical protein
MGHGLASPTWSLGVCGCRQGERLYPDPVGVGRGAAHLRACAGVFLGRAQNMYFLFWPWLFLDVLVL